MFAFKIMFRRKINIKDIDFTFVFYLEREIYFPQSFVGCRIVEL